MNPMVCLCGNIFEMGGRGSLNSSSLRWVVVLVFASGFIRGVGRLSLKRPFQHYFV